MSEATSLESLQGHTTEHALVDARLGEQMRFYKDKINVSFNILVSYKLTSLDENCEAVQEHLVSLLHFGVAELHGRGSIGMLVGHL